jgi:hypothetical protein
MSVRTPSVRRLYFVRRSFIREGHVNPISKTETPLPEPNEPQEPGACHRPREGPHSTYRFCAGHLAFAHSASGGSAPADVLGRRFDTSSTNQMHTRHNPTIGTGEQTASTAFDAFDTAHFWVSNGKTQDGSNHLTRLTDLTVTEMGVYVPGVRPLALARSRSPAALPTCLSRTVKSVKSVNCPTPSGGFRFTLNRQPWCQFDGTDDSGVAA